MRKPKNPNHPLTRLREALSTPEKPVFTRRMLADQVGIPVTSIKAIETGAYQLTPEVAIKISMATGVGPHSLMRGDDPLLDLSRKPFSRASQSITERPWTAEDMDLEKHKLLFTCLLEAAEGKDGKTLLQVTLSFAQWVRDLSFSLELGERIFNELKRYGPLTAMSYAALFQREKTFSFKRPPKKPQRLTQKKAA